MSDGSEPPCCCALWRCSPVTWRSSARWPGGGGSVKEKAGSPLPGHLLGAEGARKLPCSPSATEVCQLQASRYC